MSSRSPPLCNKVKTPLYCDALKVYSNLKKTEAAKIRSRVKWAEEGEKSTRYFFNLEKKRGQESYGIGLKRQT
jgi:hypothetical protein